MQTYTNPVYPKDFPDISILKTPDGWQLFGSQGKVGQTWHNIQTAFSKDLVHWEQEFDSLPQKSPYAREQEYWAPCVVEPWPHKRPGELRMSFNAKVNDAGQGIFVAVGKRGEPFKVMGKPLIHGPLHDYEHIDSELFQDPQNSKWYLVWGSGSKPLKACEINEELLSFAKGSEITEILKPQPERPFGFTFEGASMYTRPHPKTGKLLYYIEFSGEDSFGCDQQLQNGLFGGRGYGIQVARSENSPLGPYITYAEATGRDDSVYYRSNEVFLNPGHQARTTDAAGQTWIVAAGYMRRQIPKYQQFSEPWLQERSRLLHAGIPELQLKWAVYNALVHKDCPAQYQKLVEKYTAMQQYLLRSPRVLLLDKVEYDADGWPYVENGSPSSTSQPVPTVQQ